MTIYGVHAFLAGLEVFKMAEKMLMMIHAWDTSVNREENIVKVGNIVWSDDRAIAESKGIDKECVRQF